MSDIQITDQQVNAVPLFMCQVSFGTGGDAAIDLNVSEALGAYEALGEVFDDTIENISGMLVNDCIMLCGGLNLIFGEEKLQGTGFAIEHLLMEDNTCCAQFDEDYYNMLIEDIADEQRIKLDFLIELFGQACQATHDMISGHLARLTEYMNNEASGSQLH